MGHKGNSLMFHMIWEGKKKGFFNTDLKGMDDISSVKKKSMLITEKNLNALDFFSYSCCMRCAIIHVFSCNTVKKYEYMCSTNLLHLCSLLMPVIAQVFN